MVCLALAVAGIAFALGRKETLPGMLFEEHAQPPFDASKHVLEKATALRAYAASHHMDTSIAFLVDMNIESGQKRFFVFDFKTNKVVKSGLVTHGRCNRRYLPGRKYSNIAGSGCTSLGHYKIGSKYSGRFGTAYKLHGLDATNSNAFERFVVLHAHDCVPGKEVAPDIICQSDGCPTVAPEYLEMLSTYIDRAARPVVLEVFDDHKNAER